MAASNRSPQTDADRSDSPGMAHPTVVPRNFDADAPNGRKD